MGPPQAWGHPQLRGPLNLPLECAPPPVCVFVCVRATCLQK